MPFDKAKAAALIQSDTYQKASPEVKAAIVTRLRKEAADAGAATPSNPSAKREVHTLDLPKVGSPAWFKSKFYTYADRALPELPAIGGTVGGIVGGAGGGMFGAPVGAAEGATIGEAARVALTKAIFNKAPEIQATLPQTPEEFVKGAGVQAAMAAITEGAARGVTTAGKAFARPFEASAATTRAARAGEGIRLTPGEASGHPALRKIEAVAAHLPGGISPWERFRTAQGQDAVDYFTKQITKLARDRVPPEQLGQAVQDFVRSADHQVEAAHQAEYAQTLQHMGVDHAASEEAAGKAAQRSILSHYREMEGQETQLYDATKKHLGLQGRDVTPEEFDRRIGEHRQFRQRPAPPLEAWDTEAGKSLNAARNFTRANRPRFDSKLISAAMKTSRPEAVPRLMATASLDELRAFQKYVPVEVQHQLGQSLLSRMAKESTEAGGQVSGKKLTAQLAKLGEERGRLIYGPDRWQQMTAAANRLGTLEGQLPQAKAAFQSDLMKKIVTSNQPEAVAAMFEGASLQDLRALHGSLPAPIRGQVSANVLEGIIQRAADPQTGRLGARSIASSLRDLGEGRGRLLFGKQYDAVVQGSRLMDKMKSTAHGEGMGQMHAFRTGTALAGAASALAAFAPGHAVQVAVGITSEMAATRVITAALINPETSATALKILRAFAAHSVRAVPYAVDAVRGSDQRDAFNASRYATPTP